MNITAVPFTYNTSAVSEEQFNAHMILYRGYIAKTNDIDRDLHTAGIFDNARTKDYMIRGLRSGESYSIDGVILHEEYFRNMTKHSTQICHETHTMFNDGFGGYDKFAEAFTQCAAVARGWCVLAFEQRTKSFKIIMQDTHDSGIITMSFPIIVLDMYEHAYFLDYRTDKQKYIKAFMESIDWDVVEKRVCVVRGSYGGTAL